MNIRDVVRQHEQELQGISEEKARLRRLVELNVMEQVRNLSRTTIVQNAQRGPNPPRLHGLVYDIADGVLHNLNVKHEEVVAELSPVYATEPAPKIIGR